MPRPRAVTIAFWLTLGGACLFLTATAMAIGASWESLRETGRESFVDDGEIYTESDLDTSARTMAFAAMLFALVGTAPYITFAALMLGRRNWARVVVTVLASIGCVVALLMLTPSYTGPLAAAIRLVVVVVAGLAVTIIVLLFGRAANKYYAPVY